jgi:hypothetical protein
VIAVDRGPADQLTQDRKDRCQWVRVAVGDEVGVEQGDRGHAVRVDMGAYRSLPGLDNNIAYAGSGLPTTGQECLMRLGDIGGAPGWVRAGVRHKRIVHLTATEC